jgi:hypothetical protein
MAFGRIAVLAAVWLANIQIAVAGSAEWDEEIIRKAKDSPTGGLVFTEVKLFEDGKATLKECRHINISASSGEGGKADFRVQYLSAMPENAYYAGWAILAQGIYTINSIKCGDFVGFRGPFARFVVNKGQVLNLGSLVVRYKNSKYSFIVNRPTGDWKVEDLSPAALATLKTKSPAAFSRATKQYMIAIREQKATQ